MKIEELSKPKLIGLVREQDREFRGLLKLTKEILHNWRFYSRIQFVQAIAMFILGIGLGLIIGM